MSDSSSSNVPIEEERRRRFSIAAAGGKRFGSGKRISTHALLLEIDIRLAYCAGAWISVIVLACSAIEAQLRQVDQDDYTSVARDLFADDPDLGWLRALRNGLVHSGQPGTESPLWKIAGAGLDANHRALEDEATRAVEVMFKNIYA